MRIVILVLVAVIFAGLIASIVLAATTGSPFWSFMVGINTLATIKTITWAGETYESILRRG